MPEHIKGFRVQHEYKIIECVSQKMNMIQEALHSFPSMSLSTYQFLKARKLNHLLPQKNKISSGRQQFTPYLSISFQRENSSV